MVSAYCRLTSNAGGQRRPAGVALVEVLCSIVLLGLAVAPAVGMFTLALALFSQGRQWADAVAILDSEVAMLENSDSSLVRSTVRTYVRNGVTFTVTVTPTRVVPSDPNFNDIVIEVRWRGAFSRDETQSRHIRRLEHPI